MSLDRSGCWCALLPLLAALAPASGRKTDKELAETFARTVHLHKHGEPITLHQLRETALLQTGGSAVERMRPAEHVATRLPPSHAAGTSLWAASNVGATAELPALPDVDTAIGVPGKVPRRAFTFWSDPQHIPDLVAGCFARMKHYNPGWDFYMLYPGVTGIEPAPAKMPNACCGGFDGTPSLNVTHQADWYRAAALAKYGGIWIDSTAIVNMPFENWADLDLDAVQGWMWVGGDNAMENWAFVAPYKSRLMATWMGEMRTAWQMGPELYGANISPVVQISPELQGWNPYLTMHECFLVAWTRMPNEKVKFIASSMDTHQPLNFLSVSDWDPVTALNLIFFQMNQSAIDSTLFFKLRGSERQSAKSLITYAQEGSHLALQMLELISPAEAARIAVRLNTPSPLPSPPSPPP